MSSSIVKLFDRAMTWVYRKSDGRIKMGSYYMLVLDSVGRKSGQVRSHMLQFMPDGDKMVVVASNNGQEYHPSWYHNLLAQPQARVHVGRKHLDVRASVATDEEYAHLWPLLVAHNPPWGAYASRTTRKIPVVILQPLAANPR
jgi:deazaflavin-dependent oxidoreductase (nitroreductase family)